MDNLQTRIIIVFQVLTFLLIGTAWAGFIDFEDGKDRDVIASSIEGMEFTTTNGYDWVYGDWRAYDYNGPYPYGSYYSEGNFFAWLGEMQGTGVITFVDAYATFFKIYYSSESRLYLEAYNVNGDMLDTASGKGNLNTGKLGKLRVEAPGMAYVMIHDTGNFWLVDNLSTDAISQCESDDQCQDGQYCTGIKYCDLETQDCVVSGNPCPEDQYCDEETDSCVIPDVTDEEDNPEKTRPEEDDADSCGCGC